MEELNSNSSLVYLSLGSNLGDRLQNLQLAIDLIKKEAGEILSVSSVYETPPLGFNSDDLFYNICVSLNTQFRPEELLQILLDIEIQLGRTVKTKLDNVIPVYSSRTIDIDIIFFNNLVLTTSQLTIPHPLFKHRKFVLAPLNEIASNHKDPLSNLKIGELLAICKDPSFLYKLTFKLHR